RIPEGTVMVSQERHVQPPLSQEQSSTLHLVKLGTCRGNFYDRHRHCKTDVDSNKLPIIFGSYRHALRNGSLVKPSTFAKTSKFPQRFFGVERKRDDSNI
ncbi:7362_t:CDS:1, partial [Paraglomus occultum]